MSYRYQTDSDYRSQDAYDRLRDEVDAELEAEWDEEFEGSFPYVSDWKRIEEQIEQRTKELA